MSQPNKSPTAKSDTQVETHDYASETSPSNLDIEAQTAPTPPHVQVQDSSVPSRHHASPTSPTIKRSGTAYSNKSFELKRRPNRSNTARTYGPPTRQPGSTPGSEPGIDTSDSAPPYTPGAETPQLYQRCEITVVDWSQDEMRMYYLDNDNLAEFLDIPREEWVTTRWINVNGLSWDVIRLLGNHKGLHRLAIEDLMNTRNRTKADWYSDHTFILLSLQKLVHLHYPDDCSSDEEDDWIKSTGESLANRQRRKQNPPRGAIGTLLHDYLSARRKKRLPKARKLNAANGFAHATSLASPHAPHPVRTLQRFRGGPNEERTDFMERYVYLLLSKLVSVELEYSICLSSQTLLHHLLCFNTDSSFPDPS